MIDSIRYKNFKALRDTVLPLSPVTLIVGANGSGKTTALQALLAVASSTVIPESFRSFGAVSTEPIEVEIRWGDPRVGMSLVQRWQAPSTLHVGAPRHLRASGGEIGAAEFEIKGVRLYSFTRYAIVQPTPLQRSIELGTDGSRLAGVLDRMRDESHERFESLNDELARWLPEFDRILFETPNDGQRSFALRLGVNGQKVAASELSEGTLFSLALLTLSYLPSPPTIVCLEEPDRAIHPRLLRDVQDAIYRLAHPDPSLVARPPVQVIATTHNPYFLSLFRDHPEEVVIAEKHGLDVTFRRLSEYAHIDEILQDAPLGDVWYSGILGGVPARS